MLEKVARDQAAVGYAENGHLNGNSRAKVVYTLPG